MVDLAENSKAIYKLALQLMYEEGWHPSIALTTAVVSVLSYPNAKRILGNAYLDYINYKKALENREFEKFYDFFELVEGWIPKEEKKKSLEKIVKSRKKECLNCVIAYRLVKEHFTIENFERYKELIMLEEEEEDEDED